MATKSNRLRFTKSALQRIEPPQTGRAYYRDAGCPNLIIDVTAAGSKTFYRYGKVDGKPQRNKLGAFPETTIDQARQLCLKLSGKIADGVDPQAAKKKARQVPTLSDLHAHWMTVHSKPHKKSWREDDAKFRKHLQPWANRRLADISKTDVQNLVAKVARKTKPENGKGRERGGRYEANRLLALLKSMYGKAEEIGYTGPNPAEKVRKFAEESRDRFLQPDELPRFFAALGEEEPTVRDFFWLCLLTGARKSNVMSMAWKDISFDLALWRIPETKSGKVVVVPLVEQALAVLRARQKAAGDSPWVFPAESRTGHLTDVRKAWERVCGRAGFDNLHIHDLRRTMGAWQASTGASLAIVGRMLGHTTPSATMVYARLQLDPVRQAAEKAVAAIEAAGKAK